MACVGTRGKLCFMAGETITIDNSYSDNNGNPINLTGATITAQLLPAVGSVSKTEDWTVTPLDLSVGTFNLSLTKVESQALLPLPSDDSDPITSSFVTDIKVEYADTTVDFIAGLNIDIEQNAIR